MVLMSIELKILPDILEFGSYSSRSNWRHFARVSEEYILYIVENGEMYIIEDGIEYILKRGDLLLLEPGKLHDGYRNSICKYYYIHFKHPNISRVDNSTDKNTNVELLKKHQGQIDNYEVYSAIDSFPCCFPKLFHSNNQIELFDILESECRDFLNHFENYIPLASWKVSELLLKISREYTSLCCNNENFYSNTKVKVNSIINYINHEYPNKITSKDIEEAFEGNFDYLNRIFHEISGQTIFRYLNQVRINMAKRLIESSELKIGEIGYLVGIDDPYYFSKLFKKHTCITPTQYLREKRKKI